MDATPISWDEALGPGLTPQEKGAMGEKIAQEQNRGSQIAGELKNSKPTLTPISWDEVFPGITPKPAATPAPQTGAVGEIYQGAKRGAFGQFPQMIGQAFKWMGEEPQGLENGGRGSTTYEIGQSLQNTGEEYLDSNKLNPEAHNWMTNALASGAEMVVPSVAPIAIAALLPESLPAWVSLGLGATSMSWLYGGSQAQQTYDRGIKAGLAPEKARQAGIETGAIEAGGEILGTMALGYLFGMVGKGISKVAGMDPVDGVFAAVKNPAYFKDFAKTLPGVYGTEIGTEIGQNYGEAKVEEAHGIPQGQTGTPWEQGKQAIAPTFGMTTLMLPFGLVGHGMQARQTTVAAGALQDATAPKEVRTAAAGSVYAALKQEDGAFADQWMAKAKNAIASGAPVALDRQFAQTAGEAPQAPIASVAAGTPPTQPLVPSAPAVASVGPNEAPSPALLEKQQGEMGQQFGALNQETMSPIDLARSDAQVLKSGGDLEGADETRLRNATLVSVYGENAAVRHVIDGQFPAIADAMLLAAPTVERVRGTIQNNEQSRDITSDILTAVDEISRIKGDGGNVHQALAEGVSHDISYEGQQLMAFLDENAGSPKRIAAFLENYLQEVENATGVPSEVRGRAFDIIAERNAAKQTQEQKAAEETRKQAIKERAFQQAETVAKREKVETTKKATEQESAERVLREVAVGKAAGSGIQPEHQTTMELAFAKARPLKGKPNAKPSAPSAEPVQGGPTSGPQGGAGQNETGRVPGPATGAGKTGEPGHARPVRESSNRAGAEGNREVNRGEKIAAERSRPARPSEQPTISEQRGGELVAESQALGTGRQQGVPAAPSEAGVAPGQVATAPSLTEYQKTIATERFAGQYGKGMTEFVAKQQQRRLSTERPELQWTVEQASEFGDQRFVVAGRKSESDKASLKKNAPIASVELSLSDIPPGLKISLPVHVEELGQTVYVDRDAKQAFKEATQRVNRLQSLLNCLTG